MSESKCNFINEKRYHTIDWLRGLAIVNMVIFHGIWDLVYLFDFNWDWYMSQGAYIWQQCICWTFIFISGFCFSMGHRQLKRGFTVFLCGLLMTAVTVIFMPENRVVFGILTLLGSCMLFMVPAHKWLRKCKPILGLIISGLLFFLTRNINQGYLGFERWNFISLPDCLYQSLFGTYLGFPTYNFYSTDYFSIMPWIFLYVFGYYAQRLMEERHLLEHLKGVRIGILEWIGRHSLLIYVVHQPVLYLVLSLLYGK